MSDAQGNADSDRNEQKSDRFQREFDRILLCLLGAGLLISIVYGASAGTCPPDPQRAPVIAGPSTGPASGAPSTRGAGPQTPAPSPGAAAPSTPAATRAVVVPASAPPECSGSSGLVGTLLALSISLAALAVGAFLGFLFGLPRSLTSSDFRAAAQAKVVAREKAQAAQGISEDSGAPEGPAVRQASEVNTNLEKISDWLTTIIVGVGLTKLQEIPGGIEGFGDRLAPYFGYGGKVFGISSGLFFLIGGFFLTYVGTRVKLSFIFLWSQLMNWNATGGTSGPVVQTSLDADVVPTDPSTPVSDAVKKADEFLLSKSLADLKSPDEVLAWGKAKARIHDFTSALAAYRDVQGRVPATEKLQTDYAQVLAGAGDTAGANSVIASLATTGISPEAEREARQKVAAAAQAGQTAALRSRLQQGLYKAPSERGFEDSIAAGEELEKLSEGSQDVWVHIWLAAAYGQKHAAERAGQTGPETAEQAGLRSRAVQEVKKALELDPKVKSIIQGLYDPKHRVGDDNDLDSLRPDPDLDPLLSDDAASNT